LQGLGLEQYEQAFRENDIDPELLPELTADDLIGLGIGSIGPRRRLLAAIAALRSSEPNRLADLPEPPAIDPKRQKAVAERPQLAVIFSDLADPTARASRLDPEEMGDVIGAYHRCVAGAVSRFDGFLAKYLGDGVLAYFGFPTMRMMLSGRSAPAWR
jgi:class 3 adenylate cyclase